MNNLRYDKVNIVIHLQNQKSHYKRIMQVKKNIDFKTISKKSVNCIGPNHKFELKKQRQLQQSNAKIYNKLSEISNKNGLLQLAQLQSREKQYNSTNNYNQILQKHADGRIIKGNAKLVQRLLEIKPKVGNVYQWEKQWKKFKTDQRRIRKFNKDKSYDPQIYLRETLSSLSRLNKREAQRFSSLSRNYTFGSQGSQKTLNQQQIGKKNQCRQSKLRKKCITTIQEQKVIGPDRRQQGKAESQILKFQINQIILKEDNNLFPQKMEKTLPLLC